MKKIIILEIILIIASLFIQNKVFGRYELEKKYIVAKIQINNLENEL